MSDLAPDCNRLFKMAVMAGVEDSVGVTVGDGR